MNVSLYKEENRLPERGLDGTMEHLLFFALSRKECRLWQFFLQRSQPWR